MMNIFSAKSKTKQEKIKPLSDAPLYFVSLLQHTGQEAVPIVKIGEAVKKHQLIGEETGSFSANVHAPISGVVEDIAQHPLADGAMVTTIVIKNDFLNIEVENHNETDFDNLTAEEILLKIKTAGVVGEGGAQFPTFHKYNVEGKSIHTFIINGTECEPYLTNDYALMNESSNRLFVAINIVNKILKAENIVVTIEKQNKELLDVFSKFFG